MGHWYQLTDKGEEAIEVLQVSGESSQTVVVKQLKELLL